MSSGKARGRAALWGHVNENLVDATASSAAKRHTSWSRCAPVSDTLTRRCRLAAAPAQRHQRGNHRSSFELETFDRAIATKNAIHPAATPRPDMTSRRARWAPTAVDRRRLIGAGLAWPLAWPVANAWAAGGDAEAALRAGGVVVAIRHALAPGTFDPPGFRIGDCSTQRNLNDEGRAQARRIGEWFRARSLQPARVRTSPWCRCVDTAQLAFDRPEKWAALGSPRGHDETTNEAYLRELRRALTAASAQRGRFEVWVTHMFVLSSLTGSGTSSGEGLVLKAGANGAPEILASLSFG